MNASPIASRIVRRYDPDEKGYIRLRLDDNSLVMEHRLVVEVALGRKLEPWEIVRHEDGDNGNNDLSNLVIEERTVLSLAGHRADRTVFLTCDECAQPFPRAASEVKRAHKEGRTRFYCSKKCVGKAFGRGPKQKEATQ